MSENSLFMLETMHKVPFLVIFGLFCPFLKFYHTEGRRGGVPGAYPYP